MNLVKDLITKNRCYTKPVKIPVKKLVLHSTGVAQPNASGMIDRMNTATASTAVHAFIEADRIIQLLPWDNRGWHVGKGEKGSYNSNAIGVEICEPKGHTYNGGTMIGYDAKANAGYFAKVYQNAMELFAQLCYAYELDPLKDIICHSEAYKLGYGSNHSDVMQWFPKHGKSMDTFRQDVKSFMEIPSMTITVKSSPKDINWLKSQINDIGGVYKLDLNGVYDNKTRISVLMLWESWGWNKDGQDDGWKAGMKTINRLK